MLRLKNIVKVYKVADQGVEALKGVDLSFRKNEFVSILGPSGCGKTTLLNIIGGLDKYTSGDLFIGGKSTKEFDDRAWDVYRNHRIGFVFQSYNLIPHQTILGNVELALTIAGVSKEERISRAKKAIDKVGLAGQYYKKPNQLSGGQCQRVAIARALVNEPEILLADEPTGALDTVTSVQIMDLIKEISKEKLVIMVTHNPELANKYSSRIVHFLDGKIVEDTNPFSESDEIAECELAAKEIETVKKDKPEKAKMSLFTAFRLSFRNLLSKFKRTILTVIAGSIGIVGVSTVLAVSTGVKDYIKSMQDDMLSGNPITISEMGYDLEAMMGTTSFQEKVEIVKKDKHVNVNSLIEYLCKNDDALQSLKFNNTINQEYVDYLKSMPKDMYSAISMNYGIDITTNVFTNYDYDTTPSSKDQILSLSAIKEMYTALLNETDYSDYSSLVTSLETVLSQSINNNDYILSQYDKVYGELPTSSNEILVVLDDDSALTDLVLAQLGYYTQEEFFTIVDKATFERDNPSGDATYDEAKYKMHFTYDEIIGKEFVWYPNDDLFTKTINPINPFTYQYNRNDLSLTDDAIKLKITGIVKPKKEISYGALKTGFLYTEKLAEEIIKINSKSEIVNYVKEKGNIDSTIINGFRYGVTYDFTYYYKSDEPKTAQAFVGTSSGASAFLGMMGIEMPETYSLNSRGLGGESIPQMVSIYPLDFERKDFVTDYLDAWNNDVDVTVKVFDNGVDTGETKTIASSDACRLEIKYTDSIEIIISMITTMIDIITYALVAFTALSLVVSTVMVGIITYVSVVERTKEIGVIRSQGGRKRDVANLFTAETVMIGLASGVFGIGITYLFSLIINIVLNSVAGVSGIAHLKPLTALIMILISILLTLISGTSPARNAARRNPVDALRSE